MQQRFARIRFLLLLCAVCSAVAVGTYLRIYLTGRSPVTLPFDPGAGVQRSAPFAVYGGGLFLVELQFGGEAAKAKLNCVRRPGGGPFDCAPNPAPVSWSIYRGGQLVARDDPGPKAAVDGIVRAYGGRLDREIGSIELPAARGYVLEVRPLKGADQTGLIHPAVTLALHPWDVEKAMTWVLAFWASALGAVVTAAMAIAAAVGRPPGTTATPRS